jgi:hypothetical protein
MIWFSNFLSLDESNFLIRDRGIKVVIIQDDDLLALRISPSVNKDRKQGNIQAENVLIKFIYLRRIQDYFFHANCFLSLHEFPV